MSAELEAKLTTGSATERLRAARALEENGWQPKDLALRVRFYVARGWWSKLSRLGNNAIDELVNLFECDDCPDQAALVRALACTGEPTIAATVLEWLFQPPFLLAEDWVETRIIKRSEQERNLWLKKLKPLFHNWTKLILDAAVAITVTSNFDGPVEHFHYTLDRACAATKQLCRLDGYDRKRNLTKPAIRMLTSQLLHLVCSKKAVSLVDWDYDEYTTTFFDFDFSEQITLAADELKRRGDPASNRDIYRRPKVWQQG